MNFVAGEISPRLLLLTMTATNFTQLYRYSFPNCITIANSPNIERPISPVMYVEGIDRSKIAIMDIVTPIGQLRYVDRSGPNRK